MTRSVLAVDPGPRSHGVVLFDGQRVVGSYDMTTEELRRHIQWLVTDEPPIIACEWIASYGMPVGKEVFETVLQIGMLHAITPMRLIPRADIKLHLCGSMRAKDANIRQALLDKLGPVGTKKNPGPLYGVSGHKWAALAVAVTAAEVARTERELVLEEVG
jgi:hypothetical protein